MTACICGTPWHSVAPAPPCPIHGRPGVVALDALEALREVTDHLAGLCADRYETRYGADGEPCPGCYDALETAREILAAAPVVHHPIENPWIEYYHYRPDRIERVLGVLDGWFHRCPFTVPGGRWICDAYERRMQRNAEKAEP